MYSFSSDVYFWQCKQANNIDKMGLDLTTSAASAKICYFCLRNQIQRNWFSLSLWFCLETWQSDTIKEGNQILTENCVEICVEEYVHT